MRLSFRWTSHSSHTYSDKTILSSFSRFCNFVQNELAIFEEASSGVFPLIYLSVCLLIHHCHTGFCLLQFYKDYYYYFAWSPLYKIFLLIVIGGWLFYNFCLRVCCIAKGICHMYIHIPSFFGFPSHLCQQRIK